MGPGAAHQAATPSREVCAQLPNAFFSALELQSSYSTYAHAEEQESLKFITVTNKEIHSEALNLLIFAGENMKRACTAWDLRYLHYFITLSLNDMVSC